MCFFGVVFCVFCEFSVLFLILSDRHGHYKTNAET